MFGRRHRGGKAPACNDPLSTRAPAHACRNACPCCAAGTLRAAMQTGAARRGASRPISGACAAKADAITRA